MRKRKKKEEKPSRLKSFVYPISVVVLLAVCGYVLMPGFGELEKVRAQLRELSQVAREKEGSNEQLRREIESMETSEGIELAARRYLRLAKPDEVIVVFSPAQRDDPTE